MESHSVTQAGVAVVRFWLTVTSTSQVPVILTVLIFVFLVEMGLYHVSQAGFYS